MFTRCHSKKMCSSSPQICLHFSHRLLVVLKKRKKTFVTSNGLSDSCICNRPADLIFLHSMNKCFLKHLNFAYKCEQQVISVSFLLEKINLKYVYGLQLLKFSLKLYQNIAKMIKIFYILIVF